MNDTKFTFAGLTELRANLQSLQRSTHAALVEAAVGHANKVFAKSQAIVPLDKGPLKESGAVDDPFITDHDVTVNIVYGVDYGDWEAPVEIYAIVQHERLDFVHPRGGQAKYLEHPLLASADDLIRELAEKVKL